MALTVPLSEIVEKSSNRLLGKHASWGRVLLGYIATVLNGFAFKSSEFSNSGGVPLIRIRDVGKDQSETTYLGEYDHRYVVEPGDLLVGMDGDFNCARWRGPRGLLNQRVCKITLKSDIYLPKFLDYTLPGYLKAINDVTSSVTVKHLSSRSIEEIPLPLPPKEFQQRLVAEIEKQFSRLDEAVANLKRVKANLKRYKTAVLKAAVEGKLTEDWRKQHLNIEPASKLLERILAERRKKWTGRGEYKEPAAPEASNLTLPKRWTWATVDQISVVVRGASPRPAGDPRYFGGTIPWITVGPITADQKPYLTSVPETVTEEGRERSRYLEPHTLLLTNSGATLGVPKITLIGGCINDGVAALLDVVYPLKLYLLYFLHTQTTRLRRVNQGAAQPNLNTSIIKAINVPLPPHDEQEQIVAEVERRLSVIEELEAAVQANLTRADRLRQSILGQAFSGKLLLNEARG
jgi:type I restriction enzyme S subunit